MIERIGNVFYRISDMDAAVHFYTEVLGFGLRFRDGDRWAAFDINGMTFALEGGNPGSGGGADSGSEGGSGASGSARGSRDSGSARGSRSGSEGTSGGATVRVRDVDTLVAHLRSRGANVGDVTTGKRERRADPRDPSGNHLVLYEPLAR